MLALASAALPLIACIIRAPGKDDPMPFIKNSITEYLIHQKAERQSLIIWALSSNRQMYHRFIPEAIVFGCFS